MRLARLTDRLFPSFPSWADRFFEGDLMDFNTMNFAGTNTALPAANFSEKGDEFQIEVAAPGMKKDDFSINYDNGKLLIACEKQEEQEGESDKFSHREFSYQSFQRSFNLPEELIITDQIKATYSDGILHVILPKREEIRTKPAKEIKIS